MNTSKTDSREPSRCPHSHRSSGKRQISCTWEHRGTLTRFPQIFRPVRLACRCHNGSPISNQGCFPMANIEVSIKIDMKPTDAGRSPDKMAEQTERGCFRLVLDEAAELDIDALEDGLLRTCYPVLRDALAQHLEQAIKKSPSAAGSTRRRPPPSAACV